jgi:Transposase DDE domain
LVLVLILRKSVKSLQNVVNEAMSWLGVDSVTASAFSQARYKLKHEAFIELNRKAVVETLYSDGNYRTFWGFRVLGVDGSKIVLPNTEEVCREFGTIAYSNGKTAEIHGERPYALASVLYDVLNRVSLDARLGRADAYEVDLAILHLAHTRPLDLITMDRNYPAYRMLAEFSQRRRDFVIRCSAASFGVARRMLKGQGADSQIVTLTPCAGQARMIRQLGLPESIQVRFVRVLLSTGEWEVLVTSLLDEALYPTEGFGELYHLRWGVETFYGLLKTRLELENFTGNGAEAVKQDFHSTVYLLGLESILTDSAQAQLDAKDTRHPQKVNRAVSFNAIKNNALDLLMSDLETEPLFRQLTALFLTNPSLERKDRHPPRKKSSARVLLDFHKRQRRHCY